MACIGIGAFTYDAGRRSVNQFRQNRKELQQFGLACHNYWDTMMDPIWSIEQVEVFCRAQGSDGEEACKAIKSGRYVVIWGQSINQALRGGHPGASEQILAYEASAPQTGGLVVLLDGSVRFMPAQLFQEQLQKSYRPPAREVSKQLPVNEKSNRTSGEPTPAPPDPVALAKTQAVREVAIREEVKRLQGWWLLVKDVSKDSTLSGLSPPWGLQIEGEEFTFIVFGSQGHQGKFTVDPTGSARLIDMLVKPKEGKEFVRRGIYKLDGDKLQMCLGGPDQERPKDFDIKVGVSYYEKGRR
jgi:uncharacterized protein (TIGR03067 family)